MKVYYALKGELVVI